MGLREDREAKKQEKVEKQAQNQEKRKPRLTYVHGIDGRRYINDKILRNLEGSQGGQTFSSYSTINNYAANGYLSYDDLMEETEKLTLEANDQNSFDQFASMETQSGVAISHAQSADVANADLEAAFEQAASAGRTVHTTFNDISPGAAFQAQAFNNTPPVAEVHGFSETQATAEAHSEKVTGDINTTVYDGYHEAAKNAPFAFPAQAQEGAVSGEQQSGYATPGTVGKPKGIVAQSSRYGMLADEPTEQYHAVDQTPPQAQDGSQRLSQKELSTSQQMRALPPPVRYEQSQSQPAAPAQGKAEYNKLLGGLFKDSGPEKSAQSASSESELEQSSQPPSYDKTLGQHAESQSEQSIPSHASYEEAQSETVLRQDDYDASQAVQPAEAEEYASQPVSSKDSLLDFPATGEQPKPKIDRKKPPLPKQMKDEIYFEDNATSGKTSIFKMPTEGVVLSSRGTVELLVHKGGRMFRPHYNPVGILLRVDVSDGFSLIKGETDKAPWRMTDRDGNPLDEDDIFTVAFDKKGNLWYQTVNGKKTRFLVDGGVEVTTAGGQKTKLN